MMLLSLLPLLRDMPLRVVAADDAAAAFIRLSPLRTTHHALLAFAADADTPCRYAMPPLPLFRHVAAMPAIFIDAACHISP